MKNKQTIYLGGEKDEQDKIMPQYFESFFNKKALFLVLFLLTILLIIYFFT